MSLNLPIGLCESNGSVCVCVFGGLGETMRLGKRAMAVHKSVTNEAPKLNMFPEEVNVRRKGQT